MRTFRILFLALALTFPCTASASIEIKLGVVTKPGSAQNIVAERFKERIEESSGGTVSVRIFHSQSVGNETEILQQLQMGTLQMGIVTAGPFDQFDPVVRVINYPFLFRSNEQADAVLDGPLGAEILKSLESSGLKGLCFSENGFRNLTNDRRPVRSPEDVRGLKIRVMSSALHQAIWKTLGANPTPMPWPIYTELEQGVIDGQENPLWVMEVYKFYEIQRHMSLTRHVYSPHIDVASLSWWNRLEPETQKLISETIYEAALHQRRENREKDAERLKMLREKGMEIVENPDTEAFRQKVAGMKEMALFSEPRVKDLLERLLEATR
jgi:tripartite ATP-independent transporter DctP family solute receptor